MNSDSSESQTNIKKSAWADFNQKIIVEKVSNFWLCSAQPSNRTCFYEKKLTKLLTLNLDIRMTTYVLNYILFKTTVSHTRFTVKGLKYCITESKAFIKYKCNTLYYYIVEM